MKKADGCFETVSTQQEELIEGFPGQRRAPYMLMLLLRTPGPQFSETTLFRSIVKWNPLGLKY